MALYMIKQAYSYIKENFTNNTRPTIEIYADKSSNFANNTTLLRARIQSKHIEDKQHMAYITYTKSTKTNKGDINDWFCTCHNGKRTMGPCAHAISIILFLSNDRYSSAKKQTVRIEDIYPEPIFDESDESSDSDNNDNNMDIDNNDSDTEIDQGWADTDEFVYLGNDPAEHMTLA